VNRSPVPGKIGAEPATLTRDEFWARYDHINSPEKFEAIHGKLFWSADHQVFQFGGDASTGLGYGTVRLGRSCQPDQSQQS
jgi:hypothetical protein